MIKRTEVLHAIELGEKRLEEVNAILDGTMDNHDGVCGGVTTISILADELIYISDHLLRVMGEKNVI
jgi:hypothetical protein